MSNIHKTQGVVLEAINIAYAYLKTKYKPNEMTLICKELEEIGRISEHNFNGTFHKPLESYFLLQEKLSKLNEKERIRKDKGVYYTPSDVVRFIITSSIKAVCGVLNSENINADNLDSISSSITYIDKTVFDPTCGSGEFLLAMLEKKFHLLDSNKKAITKADIKKIVATIYGNDVNVESIIITGIRLYLAALNKYGVLKCAGLASVIKECFSNYDYVTEQADSKIKYDIIIGNPPYVEDSKSGLNLNDKYGNIYANVLINSTQQLKENGFMGFIIPLSYISTPRMHKLREELFVVLTEQYILSYADRPDCLFDSVHQKLCIMLGKNVKKPRKIFTSSYRYWYKSERHNLFETTQVVENNFYESGYIPKLGTEIDCTIYKKIRHSETVHSIYADSRKGVESVYLNRRETFWMKAYRTLVADPEYKVFSFNTPGEADYCYCLINSSLFWWYWISVSDCWHVSKDLNGFMTPRITDFSIAMTLASELQKKLEETKSFINTKQTEYEYKHRACINEIHAIDDFVNSLYGLTHEESEYIKNYAIKYRTSMGGK